ncbi:MAG TPA: hypothetical protein PLJ35_16800 [Anaerolineae bacterium]|nr:hypothetical protein [Anaerolineae bacterium]HOR00472.1 hypothetical protein [Anaerolineae bacterium]HPL30844.1 hypothetical protein [Anaerolineae bacterium]
MTKRRILLFASVGLALIVVGALAATAAPVQLLLHYPLPALAAEAATMNRCAECHDLGQLHTCEACHDEHGGANVSSLPFNSLVLLTGDVPEEDYIPIEEVLPSHDGVRTHVTLLSFLAAHGVSDFESVTLASTDGGLVTIERQYVTDEALLLPHVDGMRLAAENLHVSTWLKGIMRIVVVGAEKPLMIDGQATSIGRLLLGPQLAVTVEQTDVMLKSETDGQVRRGKTAARLEGAPVTALIAQPGWRALTVRDAAGREQTLTAEDAAGAVVALVRGRATLVRPGRGRGEWVAGVIEIKAER